MAITVQALLNRATTQLAAANIATARLDVLVLLEDCLHTNRALLLAHPETELTAEQLSIVDKQIARRAQHEPLAYIRGQSEFYGRVFTVNNNVLVPRPESETMIDLLKRVVSEAPSVQPRTIIDVGTGSGALAITAKLELPTANVTGIDIDSLCLDVAAHNSAMHQAHVTFLAGDLLRPIMQSKLPPQQSTVLVCNLPYVPDNYPINQAASHEPRLALFAGADGLDLYRRLFEQQASAGWRSSYILTESLPQQQAMLADIAASYGYVPQTSLDFITIYISK